MTDLEQLLVARRNLGLDNPTIKRVTGLRWFQVNRIREQVARRREWVRARRFLTEAERQGMVVLLRFHQDGRMEKRGPMSFARFQAMPSADLVGWRVALVDCVEPHYHALSVLRRTRRNPFDPSYRALTHSNGSYTVAPLEVL